MAHLREQLFEMSSLLFFILFFELRLLIPFRMLCSLFAQFKEIHRNSFFNYNADNKLILVILTGQALSFNLLYFTTKSLLISCVKIMHVRLPPLETQMITTTKGWSFFLLVCLDVISIALSERSNHYSNTTLSSLLNGYCHQKRALIIYLTVAKRLLTSTSGTSHWMISKLDQFYMFLKILISHERLKNT